MVKGMCSYLNIFDLCADAAILFPGCPLLAQFTRIRHKSTTCPYHREVADFRELRILQFVSLTSSRVSPLLSARLTVWPSWVSSPSHQSFRPPSLGSFPLSRLSFVPSPSTLALAPAPPACLLTKATGALKVSISSTNVLYRWLFFFCACFYRPILITTGFGCQWC
ncbi:hypothetical protein BJ165DRAFT_264471 [Panaeolus papilionaceus]|nr:hypothetical protein BJ165DRAFT_264471 [Panaeolus papilionaceus]